MKKVKNSIVAFMAVALFAVFTLGSCQKLGEDEGMQPNKGVTKVAVINGDYILKNGDITTTNEKSADLGQVNITWTMLTDNTLFYPTPGLYGGKWSLVDGREFITGSVADNFWSNSANNPVTFPTTGTGVYSNQTPDENVRLIAETKNAANEVVFLGMVDFNPSAANFPLTVNGFRLGDSLVINADAITSLPGGQYLTVTASFDLAPIDLAATKMKNSVSGTHTTPSGTQFEWSDIVYGPAVPTTVTIGSGNFTALSTLAGKIMGNIRITLSETGVPYQPSATIWAEKAAKGPGQGLKLTLKTNKIGWYDSGIINWHNEDIELVDEDLEFN